MKLNFLFILAAFLLIASTTSVSAIPSAEGMSNPNMLYPSKNTNHSYSWAAVGAGFQEGNAWTIAYRDFPCIPYGNSWCNYEAATLPGYEENFLDWYCDNFNGTSYSCIHWKGQSHCFSDSLYNVGIWNCTQFYAFTNICLYWSGDMASCNLMGRASASSWNCTAWRGNECVTWVATSSGGMASPDGATCVAWHGDYCQTWSIHLSAGMGGVAEWDTQTAQDPCYGITCGNTCANGTMLNYSGICGVQNINYGGGIGVCSYYQQFCTYGCVSGSCRSPTFTITLNSPSDLSSQHSISTNFTFSVNNIGYDVTNCSFYNFSGGAYHIIQNNQTNLPTSETWSYSFNYTPSVGNLTWTVGCYFNKTHSTFATPNRQLFVLSGIYGVTVNNITNESAVITWLTSGSENSTVDYGATPSLGNEINDASYVSVHHIPLTGLNNRTPYYFNVTSCDTTGDCETLGEYNFTTLNVGWNPFIVSTNVDPNPSRINRPVTYSLVWESSNPTDLIRTRICSTDLLNASYECDATTICSTSPSLANPVNCTANAPAIIGSFSYYAFICNQGDNCSSETNELDLTTYVQDPTTNGISPLGVKKNVNVTFSTTVTIGDLPLACIGWHWGDGTNDTEVLSSDGVKSFVHNYTVNITYDAAVKVCDNRGGDCSELATETGCNIANTTINVTNLGPGGWNCTNATDCESNYCNNGFCCDSGTCCNAPHVQDSCPSNYVCTDNYNCTSILANCQPSNYSWLCNSGYADHGYCCNGGWCCGTPGMQSSCYSNYICYSSCACTSRAPACGNYTSTCMAPQPYYCDAYGQLINSCGVCGCPLGYSCSFGGSCTLIPVPTPTPTPTPDPSCGYYRNVCTNVQPYYCNTYGQLVPYCSVCGCSGGLYCANDQTCGAHMYWYEFWTGINWWNWSTIILIMMVFVFIIGVAVTLKRWTTE